MIGYFRQVFLSILGSILCLSAFGQNKVIYGLVTDSLSVGVPQVNVIWNSNRGSNTDALGRYRISVEDTAGVLTFRHLEYFTANLPVNFQGNDSLRIDFQLKINTRLLDQVEIRGAAENVDTQAGAISLNPRKIQSVPSPFQDISRILVTLPGVSAANEMSSTYNVRGGNYEENLIYVDDIPIYRPFLITAGRQEGLGFINMDLVSNIDFYAGGWQPKYGDKLASSLNISYKQPEYNQGSVTLGLLGGSAHYEGISNNGRIRYIGGIRHKDSRYLLNSLEVDGEYFPTFTDFQSYTTIDLSSQKDRSSELSMLLSYARNRYETFPESRQSDFGTLSANFRLFVALEGTELMKYDTYQAGFKWKKRWNDKLTSSWILSGVTTDERERYEVEGGYRLCDLNTNPGSSTFDECVLVRGIGTNYQSGRNQLSADILNLENRNKLVINDQHLLEGGFGWGRYLIDDELREYAFTDSANFVELESRAFNEININSNQFTGYVQHTMSSLNDQHTLTYGVRLNYWDYNEQLLVSPRLQYAYQPDWVRPLTIRFATGLYQQPPFYRELRDRAGQIKNQVEAQSSLHFILGSEYQFQLWGRPFVFFNEAYYKHLYNLNLYDIENVRLRYFANNNATGYAAGVDFRVHGEFIPGTESWFSLGILKTEEDLADDGLGYFRRPSDQRINLSIFFQDHMPNDPTLNVALTLLYGSGLPFGPPNQDNLRNAFSGDEYYRADIGFSKIIKPTNEQSFFDSIWIGLEVLNLFGAQNTISYTWVNDVINNQFAVPNSLSARFLNLRVQGKF